MRTVGHIRFDTNQRAPHAHDSVYKPIERTKKHFNPLTLPKTLVSALPFKSKPKNVTKRSHKTLETKRAVVMNSGEKKVHRLMQQLNTLTREKEVKRKVAATKSRDKHLKEIALKEAKSAGRKKDEAKAIYRRLGKEEKSREFKASRHAAQPAKKKRKTGGD